MPSLRLTLPLECPVARRNGNSDTIDLTGFNAATTIIFASGADGKSALVLSKPAMIKGALDSDGQPLVSLLRSKVSGTPSVRLLSTSSELSIYGLAPSNGNTTRYLFFCRAF